MIAKKIGFLYYRYTSKCWYLSLKIAPEAVSDKNRTKFFKANFDPLKLTFLCLFWIIMGKIKYSLCFEKKAVKEVNFWP